MARYILGVMAIAIALGTIAFNPATKSVKKFASTTFFYEPASYGQTAVQTKTNWKSNITPPQPCAGTANKACKMDIDDKYSHLEGTVRVLNTSTAQGSVLSISAITGANSTDYVPNPSMSGVSNINNKP